MPVLGNPIAVVCSAALAAEAVRAVWFVMLWGSALCRAVASPIVLGKSVVQTAAAVYVARVRPSKAVITILSALI